MNTITKADARMILDCRGYPTVQVDVWAGDVPAGAAFGDRPRSGLLHRDAQVLDAPGGHR
jgi:enolase